jgi:hypothetical protein
MEMFIITGIGMTIIIGVFVALMLTSEMKRGWKKNLTTILLALAIGFGIGGLLTLDHIGDEQRWNNGHCTCGGEWELADVEKGYRNGSTTYYYSCEECNEVISTHTNFK